MKLLLFTFLIFSQASLAQDCVVILHGLGRSSLSMLSIARTLENSGYIVVNNSYSSTTKSIKDLSSVVGDDIDECKAKGAERIDFVTHSLGGILVREYFQDHAVPEARRLVMIGPPNQGSGIVTKYKDTWWFKLFTGPAGQDLGTEATSVPNVLEPIPLEVGVIAGTKSAEPWFSGLLPEPNDGKVTVESAKLAEMKDFITVPQSHTFMPGTAIVSKQVSAFLAQGHFEHDINK